MQSAYFTKRCLMNRKLGKLSTKFHHANYHIISMLYPLGVVYEFVFRIR
jgi:hypothetical protein